MRKIKFFTGLLFFFSAFHAMSVQVCKNYAPDKHPDSRYTVHNDGTVTDTQTGLMWKVCSEGQTWNAGNCEGTAGTFNWQAALKQSDAVNSSGFAGHKNWRVPDIKELTSLARLKCWYPSINLRIFPGTSNQSFWSSSPSVSVNDSNFAWHLNFIYGDDGRSKRDYNYRVRLVRYVQ